MTLQFAIVVHRALLNFDIEKAYAAVRNRFPGIDYWEGHRTSLEILFADIRRGLGITVEQEKEYLDERDRLQRFAQDWHQTLQSVRRQLQATKANLSRDEYAYRLAAALENASIDPAAGDVFAPAFARIAALEQHLTDLTEQHEREKKDALDAIARHQEENQVLMQFTEYCERRRESYGKPR